MISWKDSLMKSQTSHGRSLSSLVRRLLAVIATTFLFSGVNVAYAQNQGMMVRISEIEVDAKYLEEYKAILKYEAEASIRLEPGVIAIFPMYQREKGTEFRILEMYASREAYEAHLKTPHFQKYKSGTLHMVKSLKLVDMETLDAETMTKIFQKANGK